MFTCGTSHYLKHTFGVGYNLTVVKKEDADAGKIEKVVKKHVGVGKPCHVDFAGVVAHQRGSGDDVPAAVQVVGQVRSLVQGV